MTAKELISEACRPDPSESVTFGQLLNLYDSTRTCVHRRIRVTLPDRHSVVGPTASGVWEPFDDWFVTKISVDYDVLLVWIAEDLP